jgi:signal transduction histidine kinase
MVRVIGDDSMYDLTHFRLEDMVACGSALRSLGADASHMEPVANAVVRYLYDHLRAGGDGPRACALVRLYKTHVYADLEPDLREIACTGLGDRPPSPAMKCLTLLATVGDQEEWNSRRSSVGHRAIPLYSQEQVDHIPMVAQLIRQFGLECASVLAPDPAIMLDLEQRTYNVFHVLQARGSPYIPAQDEFVIPFGVRSVLGFGGVLPSGDLFAVILFAKVPIPAGTAEFFKTIALNVKVALLPHDATAVFAPREAGAWLPGRLAESRFAALAQLLDVQEQTALAQTVRLHGKNDELEIALRQLRETQEQLVAKERLASLGALTAGIAHEIKNPLNFVTNFAELSADLLDELEQQLDRHADRLDGEASANLHDLMSNLKQNAQKIHEHGGRADAIVRTMLQHSRGDAARRRPTELNELLAQYTNLAYHGLRAQDPTLHLAIATDFDPAIGQVDVIPEHLSRVVLNLVNNACYAAHDRQNRIGGEFAPAVNVSSRDRGDHIEIRVRDNGDGIPEPLRARIFDPFFTTKPPGRGTGLGLSLSHDIVVGEHGGELRAECREGEWTEFIVTIPRASSGQETAPS